MSSLRLSDDLVPLEETATPPIAPGADPETPMPWEKIAAGRYMPRRIRGSCVGRELG
ncbi:MAG TPA: hypothetical protein VKE94_18985 [Gemmataceae bacterium]|nr:hypothetical protein [Gemmataceae bacterium]